MLGKTAMLASCVAMLVGGESALSVRSATGYCIKCEDWVEIYYPSKYCPKCGKKIIDVWPPA